MSGTPEVHLRAEPDTDIQPVVQQLAVGLSASGIGVCGSDEGASIARVVIVGGPHDASPTVRVEDDVTHKRLERRLELSGVPVDGRPVAIALYVEELLQVSWAELAMRTRAASLHAPVDAPPEVAREVARALPPLREQPQPAQLTSERRRRTPPGPLRLSIGGSLTRYRGGLSQAGPVVGVGYRLLAWLEASVRFAYRLPARTRARNGRVDTQSIVGGAQLTPRVRLPAGVSLVFPQGLDVIGVTFLARANEDAIAKSASRVAVLINHGAGLSAELSRGFSLCALGRVSWTASPAEASDDGRVVVGIAGVGGEGELSLNAHF